MSLLGMIPSSLYSPAGFGANMPSLQTAASFSSSPVVQERPQAAKQFMIPAPAEKKRIEMYSPVSRASQGYSIEAIRRIQDPIAWRIMLVALQPNI